MSRRTLQILGAVCLLLAILFTLVLYHRVPHDNSPYAKALDHADQVTLQQGSTQVFLHQDKGGWTVAASKDGPYYPIEAGRWISLESGLKNVQLEDVISERADRAADFQVDAAGGLRVTVRDHAGALLADGVFGKQAMDATHIYFRFPDQPKVYLARGLYRGDLGGADFSGWRTHDLVTLSEAQIDAFRIQQGKTIMDVQKSSASWTLNGFPADADKVNTWLGAFAHLRADDFVDRKSTSAPVAGDLRYAEVTAKSAGAQVTLRVGAPDAKTQRYPVSTTPENGIAWIAAPRMLAILVKPVDLQKK